jgi:hypothetical protein
MINAKIMKKISIMIIVALLSSSCTFTPKLYEMTDPNQYVRVEYGQIKEEDLREKNITYFKDDESASFYIAKSTFQKFQDYSIRTLVTPVAVVLDTATIMVVGVGFLIVTGAIGEAKRRGQEAEDDRRRYNR